MKYRTQFTAEARAELRAVEMPTARRILAKLTELESDPFGVATTSLVDRPASRRLRVGDWRVVYELRNEVLVVLVVQIGPIRSVRTMKQAGDQ